MNSNVQQEQCLQRYQSTHAWKRFSVRDWPLYYSLLIFCWGSFGLVHIEHLYVTILLEDMFASQSTIDMRNPNIYLYQYHHVPHILYLFETNKDFNELPRTGHRGGQ